ncbi:uncharacterized protein LOC119370480 [Jatropha curcas]|uniref:uncharacterized protein LOC119370480 n=1 Tax=Jatropha curcas TaxID=180498 RepID=UPI001893DF19|nr:uncharacterized protein LOC119370480 [Jatropha curcas]
MKIVEISVNQEEDVVEVMEEAKEEEDVAEINNLEEVTTMMEIPSSQEAEVVDVEKVEEEETGDQMMEETNPTSSVTISSPKQIEETANNIQEEDVTGTVLLTHDGEINSQNNMWYLDTAASNHMTGNKKIFVKLDRSICGNVVFGDKSKIDIRGKGTTLIRRKNGCHQFTDNVYFVPNLKSNILSLGQLLEKDYEVHMMNRKLLLLNEKKELAVSKSTNVKETNVSLEYSDGCCKMLESMHEEFPLALAFKVWASQFWRAKVTKSKEDGAWITTN